VNKDFHNVTLGNLAFFQFSHALLVRFFLAKIHGNGRCESTRMAPQYSLASFLKNSRMDPHKLYWHKLKSTLNNLVVNFHDNYGLIFKGSEDKVTNIVERRLLLTLPPFLQCGKLPTLNWSLTVEVMKP